MTHRPARSARRRTAVVSSVCLTAALIGVATSASAAQVAPGGAPSAVAISSRVSPADAAAAVARWTPERRAAAIDDGSGQPMSALAASDAATRISRADQVTPVSHIGRIFYDQNGESRSCTANVVQSANGSTLATAGHCLSEGQTFSTDIVFYPAYEDGDSAYGAWPVVGGATTDGWYRNGDQRVDSAFLAVGTDDSGDDIASVVGASPVLFDQEGAQEVSIYGYPTLMRFDGEHLDRCRGLSEHVSAPQLALPCDMNEGVSGGPILEGDGPDGAQFGNVAERYGDFSHVLGPLWQATEHAVYDTVAAIQP